MADTPDISDDDIEDVSLIDQPAEPTDKPSEPEETPEEKGSDAPDKPEEKAEAKDTEAKEGEDPQGDESKEEQPKVDPKLAARQAYQHRQQTRQHVATQIDQVYSPKTEEELIEEGYSKQDAQFQAFREEMAFKEQRAQIAEMNAGLQAEAVNVAHDFDVYNPESKDFDPEFAQQVSDAYQTAARLQLDENGIVVNAEVGLYDFYEKMANIYRRGASKGSEQGQSEALQMLSRTENPGGSPPNGSGDSLADLEEKLGDMVIT